MQAKCESFSSTMSDQGRKVASSVAVKLGYQILKERQMDVILHILRGRDVFAILPTGYGKSLCYACLPWIFDEMNRSSRPSIVIVTSPLTAIMIDQVRSTQCKSLQLVNSYCCDPKWGRGNCTDSSGLHGSLTGLGWSLCNFGLYLQDSQVRDLLN